jgi:hypothetical protein
VSAGPTELLGAPTRWASPGPEALLVKRHRLPVMKSAIRVVKREEREAAGSLPAQTSNEPVSVEKIVKKWIIASRARRETEAIRLFSGLRS